VAFIDRSPRDGIAPMPPRPCKELIAATLLLALAAAVALRAFVSPDALAPAVATLLFACAALTAGAARVLWHSAGRAGWFDAAGMLTLIGVGISLLIEPDQMVRLVTFSDQPQP
jgi:hypothetical protein